MLLDCFDCKVAHTFKALKIGLFPKKFVRSLIRVDPAMLLDCFDFTINVCAINVCANVCATLQSMYVQSMCVQMCVQLYNQSNQAT